MSNFNKFPVQRGYRLDGTISRNFAMPAERAEISILLFRDSKSCEIVIKVPPLVCLLLWDLVPWEAINIARLLFAEYY
jgi:hypothetical protein